MSLEEIKRKLREKIKNRYEEDSLKRLLKIIETKIKTTFIGSISAIEERFGFLWGHGKPYSDLTEQEKQFFDLWTKCRTDILNNGNTQLRAIQTELDMYTVFWNRYKIEFNMKNKQEDFNG